MLEIIDLVKYYGDLLAVDKINLKVEKGEIFGFIGPNGAGKSTTIRCIMNLINKTSGNILIDGRMVSKDDFDMKKDIGYLPSEIHLYDDLTVGQMINYSASFYHEDHSKRISDLVKKLDLDLEKKVEELSLGNLKKLGIVLALLHEPKILILDEATSGLDPLMQEVFYEILLEEKKKGTTIFFSSHILSEIKRICDRVAIIKEGHIIKIDTINNLFQTDFYTVTVKGKLVNKLIKELKIKSVISNSNDRVKFIYSSDINDLINSLNSYQVDQLLIEEPALEEVFIHYYK